MKKIFFTLCFSLFSFYSFAQARQATVAPDDGKESCHEIEVFDMVEEDSTPVLGMQGFYQFLADNFVYPEESKELAIEGITYVRFVISKEGNVICAEIIEGREVGYGLDEEAMRVIKMTKWNPGRQKGEAINQRKILPFRFNAPKPSKKKKKGNY